MKQQKQTILNESRGRNGRPSPIVRRCGNVTPPISFKYQRVTSVARFLHATRQLLNKKENTVWLILKVQNYH